MLPSSKTLPRRAFLLLALPVAWGAALASCSGEPEQRAPGPTSADEERAVLQAAEMLDERRPTAEGEAEAE